MLDLQNAPMRDMQLQGMRLTPLPFDSRMAKFDLTLTLAEGDEDLSGSLEYSTDLFDAQTAGRMIGQLEVLLASIASSPDSRLSRLEILPEGELRRLRDLAEGFGGEATASSAASSSGQPAEASLIAAEETDARVHELFEEQARRRPEAIALRSGGESVTYGELDRRAGRLAVSLSSAGVGPEVRVGLCAERSVEMILGILAILKAGGAYVPIDPDYPSARVEQMLEDSAPAIVLAQARYAGRLSGCGAAVLTLDETREASRPANVDLQGRYEAVEE